MAKADAVGRQLDFLVQEMNREINTIGSKANDAKIAQLVVEMKSELEKIREQTPVSYTHLDVYKRQDMRWLKTLNLRLLSTIFL